MLLCFVGEQYGFSWNTGNSCHPVNRGHVSAPTPQPRPSSDWFQMNTATEEPSFIFYSDLYFILSKVFLHQALNSRIATANAIMCISPKHLPHTSKRGEKKGHENASWNSSFSSGCVSSPVRDQSLNQFISHLGSICVWFTLLSCVDLFSVKHKLRLQGGKQMWTNT